MSSARISIVIPTHNGMATLPALLEALQSQRTNRALEIIAVDSGSTDGTAELLSQHAQDFISIRPDQFDHGLTRNLGLAHAHGDFVVLMVQDAIPASSDWLEALIGPLVADATLAGTFARQVPHDHAHALTRHYLARWVASAAADRTARIPDRARFDTMTPAEQMQHCAFDNVCSCIRRSVWATHPFRSTPIAEDLEWAREVLLAGYGLAFVPKAEVRHSHDRPARCELQRTRALHARLFALFGLQTIPTRASLLRAIVSSLVLHVRCESRTPWHLPRALALAVAWPLGQYLGARDAQRAKGDRRLRPGLV